MNPSHKQFQEAYDELHAFAVTDKIIFLEVLLFQFTISVRGIWDNAQPSDAEKVEAFKWLNELHHRIWNIRFELQKGEDDDSITRLFQNLKFYGEQSDLLRSHLVPTVLAAYGGFKQKSK